MEFTTNFDPKGFTYVFPDIEVLVHGPRKDRWLVSIHRDDSTLGMDIIDPTSAPSRSRLVKSLIGVSPEDRNRVSEILLGLAVQIGRDFFEAAQKNQAEAAEAAAATREAELKEEIAALEPEVLPLAQDPALLYKAAETIRGLGVAGEEGNVPLLYLILASRLLADPISCSVKGESSGGKNNLVAKTVEMFSKDAYIDLTGMSEKALVYDPEPFSHRTVIVYEVHGNEAADYFIRSLQSEGRIKYKTVIDMMTVTIEKEGPTNFITTTTQPELHAENETRQWSVFVDESEETTRLAKEIAANEAAGTLQLPSVERWRDLQRWLQIRPIPTVIVPYAPFLVATTPDKPLRIRRDFRRLLAAIDTVAFLYQGQRTIDEQGRLISTVADYAMARPLVISLVQQAQAGLNQKTRLLVEAIREAHEAKGEKERWVTYRDLIELTGLSKSQVSKWIAPAIEEGFVENLEESKGKLARLVPGLPLKESAGLPAVEDVAAAFPHLSRGTYVDPITGGEHSLLSPDPEDTEDTDDTPAAEADSVSENGGLNRRRSNDDTSLHHDDSPSLIDSVPDRRREGDDTPPDRDADTEEGGVSTVAGVFAGGEDGWVDGLRFEDDDPLKDKRVHTWTLAVKANLPHLPGVVERPSRDTYATIAQRDKEPRLDTVISALEAHLVEANADEGSRKSTRPAQARIRERA